MGEVIKLEEQRPHISITGKESIHICPVVMFENIISGKLLITDIENINDFGPMIIEEWLNSLD